MVSDNTSPLNDIPPRRYIISYLCFFIRILLQKRNSHATICTAICHDIPGIIARVLAIGNNLVRSAINAGTIAAQNDFFMLRQRLENEITGGNYERENVCYDFGPGSAGHSLPGREALKRKLAAGMADTLFISSPSRLSRRLSELNRVIGDTLVPDGIQLISIESGGGRFTLEVW